MPRVPQLYESNLNPEKEEKHHCITQKIANYAKIALPMIFDETKKKRPVVEGLSNLLLHSKQDVLMPWAWGPRLFFLLFFKIQVVVVAFSSCGRILGKCLTIHALPVLFFFF